MYSLIISFIVANCVLTVFNKDNDDDDDVFRMCEKGEGSGDGSSTVGSRGFGDEVSQKLKL